MPFQKSPPALVTRFDELAGLAPEATRKQMFGFPSLVLGGHMFMGLYEDHLVLRLGADDRAALLAGGGLPFEPMPGRPIKDYVVVPEDLVADTAAMGDWVARALTYASSLPPKKPKAPATKAGMKVATKGAKKA